MALHRKTLLIFSQTFVPDPASVGQHMADVAIEMARRGYRVKVYTSACGYDDPTQRYPKRENLHGVEVRRLAFSSFGKKSILTRVIGTVSFMTQCFFLALLTPNVAGIFFSTSPPLIGIVAAVARLIRRIPIAYWAMDLNPDQLIALGKLRPTDFLARLLERVNRIILNSSSLVVALDRFMAERLRQRADVEKKMQVLPPWPHEEHLAPLAHDQNPFRARHALHDSFVVMYSGNHSPANPLDTLLKATLKFRDQPRLRFLFIGGGIGKKDVETFIQDHALANVISLPYQPLADLRYSLSAADLHVVSLGSDMVGIVHPCKIYGAMAVGGPILYLGPRPSHISDLLDAQPIGQQVAHGDVAGMIAAIERLSTLPPETLRRMRAIAQSVLASRLSQSILCGRFCDHLEQALKLKGVTCGRTSLRPAGLGAPINQVIAGAAGKKGERNVTVGSSAIDAVCPA